MSHFTVLVICPEGTDIHNYEERVTEQLAPYNEEREVQWRPAEDDDDEGYWHNPDGHWDWWSVGGRWRGYFPIAPGVSDDDLKQVVCSDSRTNNPLLNERGFDPRKQEGQVDGGPKRCLGFDKLRDRRGREAIEQWNQYAVAIAGTEQHTHWSELYARYEAAEKQAALALGMNRTGLVERAWREASIEGGFEYRDDGWPKYKTDAEYARWKAIEEPLWEQYEAQWNAALSYSIKEARDDYWKSQRVSALKHHEAFKKRFMGADEIDALDRSTRDEYEQRARNTAVPTYAVILADGTWCAPGRMGWFGMSSDDEEDRQGFAERMNTYLDELADDTFMVVVDCHV